MLCNVDSLIAKTVSVNIMCVQKSVANLTYMHGISPYWPHTVHSTLNQRWFHTMKLNQR